MRAATLRLHQEFANAGDHLCAVQLDIGHEGLMRETSHPVFQVEAGRAESGEIGSDFLGDGLWRPHVERSLRPNLMQKGFLGRDGEAAGLADAADDLAVTRPERFAGLLVGHVDMTRRMHAHRQRRAPETLQAFRNSWENGAKRNGGPPMIASISEKPWRAARMTDCGLPPTPIHTGNGPNSVCGTTSWWCSGARVLPCQVTGPPFMSSAKRLAFSSKSSS